MPDGKSRDNMLTTKLANGDWPSSLVRSPPTHRCGATSDTKQKKKIQAEQEFRNAFFKISKDL